MTLGWAGFGILYGTPFSLLKTTREGFKDDHDHDSQRQVRGHGRERTSLAGTRRLWSEFYVVPFGLKPSICLVFWVSVSLPPHREGTKPDGAPQLEVALTPSGDHNRFPRKKEGTKNRMFECSYNSLL